MKKMSALAAAILSAAICVSAAQADEHGSKLIFQNLTLQPTQQAGVFTAYTALALQRPAPQNSSSFSVVIPNVRNSEEAFRQLPDAVKQLAKEIGEQADHIQFHNP